MPFRLRVKVIVWHVSYPCIRNAGRDYTFKITITNPEANELTVNGVHSVTFERKVL